MLPLLFAGIAFTLWALFIINIYYSTHYSSIDHVNVDYIGPLISSGQSFMSSPFWKYIMTVVILYLIYKATNIFFLKKSEIRFWVFSIVGVFLLHLLIISGIYASMPEGNQMMLPLGKWSWMSLFFHIIGLLIYPVILTLITRVSGQSIMKRIIPDWINRDTRMTILVDTTIWFFVFATLLLVIGMMGYYTLTWLMLVLALLAIVWWDCWISLYQDILKFEITIDHHTEGKWLIKFIAPKLLTIEFSFFVLTLMMSVAMISIIRPMPIWWDDLGVYMNYPKILALTGETLPWIGMYVWQMITGSWFLFGYNASQAFFVNQLWSILAVIAITLGLSILFEQKDKKSLLGLPLILATLYYVMPMTVFHHTKDMKLDPALLFVSISVFMLFFTSIKKALWWNKDIYILLVIIGILIGFAFSIKVTTLMLLLAVLGLFAYRMLWFLWYLWFFFAFLAVFTGLNLWSMMNIWIPTDSVLMGKVSLWLWMSWLVSFGLAIYKNWPTLFRWYITWSLIMLLWFILWISPWIIKNTGEVKPWNLENIDTKTVAIQSILGWSGAGFPVDFTKIMTPEEYRERSDIIKSTNISSDGQSKNEDFWRYFGYEEGINNYLRLPFNLTFQKNQWWEFTSITYIFLALVPVLFLFARGRYRWIYGSVISGVLVLLFVYGFMSSSSSTETGAQYPIGSMLQKTHADIVKNADAWGFHLSDISNVFIKRPILVWLSTIELGDTLTQIFSLKLNTKYPLLYGYGILLVLNLIFVTVIHFLTRDDEEDKNFRDMFIMLNVYGFLFLISAFWIVWYGIFVYFIFFALIGLLARRFTDYTESDMLEENTFAIKGTLTMLLFMLIWLYFVRTAIPHAWTNLGNAGFNEYKYGILNQEETLFAYRSDYLIPIATMNLKDTSTLTGVIAQVSSPKLKELLIETTKDRSLFLEAITQLIPQAQKSKDAKLKRDGEIMANYIYNKVLYPTKEDAHTGGIYRIGTFMTYLINKNLQRYYDDSLIFWFDGYFYDENPETTIEKMKTLGFKFLLIDLNAATIDRDPRRALTQRYEHLLLTMRARNLSLVDTDNLCLRFALDEYKAGKLQDPAEFIAIAGTNYESYQKNWSGELAPIGRGQKQRQCYNAMLASISNEGGAEKYDYLASIKDAIEKNNATNNPELLSRIMMTYAGQSFFALYEITDTPVEPTTPMIIPTQSGATAQ